MDGNADASWFPVPTLPQTQSQGSPAVDIPPSPWVRPAPRPWPHAHLGVSFPLPDEREAILIQSQLLASVPGDSEALLRGPAGRWLREFLAWGKRIESRFIPGNKVTGNWKRAASRWAARLGLLQNRHRAAAVLKIIRHGGYFNFNAQPPVIRVFRNHPELRLRTDAVWATLSQQLREGSAIPFDTKRAVLRGASLLQGVLPRGLSSIRWVPKKHSTSVRVTMNMSPYKPFFDDDAVAVELDTNLKLRHRICSTDVFLGADQHNSFFHYAIAPPHRTYTGFSLHVKDFPPGVGLKLARQYPQAVLLLGASLSISRQRFSLGDFRLVFVMAGLPMGISPAVKMLSFVMDAIIDVWSLFPVGSGESIELPRGSNYIDDSAFMLSRSYPSNGFELSCRLVLECVLLGFRLSWLKGHFLPTP